MVDTLVDIHTWIIIGVMSPFRIRITLAAALVACGLFLAQFESVAADVNLQQPTVSIPTVTGTPEGPTVTVAGGTDVEYVNLRAGPGQDYPKIGILVRGQKAAALGTSRGGDWIEIAYPGIEGGKAWVHYSLVKLSDPVQVVSIPATPTPRVTPTLNPTLEAQYLVESLPTRLPTFTSPPPVIIPTFSVESSRLAAGTLPIGLIVIGLAVVGMFGAMITILRGR